MSDRHLVLFGAGMTGRGQIAQFAFEDGWQLTLVDSKAQLVRLLREAGQYTVRLLGSQETREVTITGFQALHSSQAKEIAAAVCSADLVATSVLPSNIPQVAEMVAGALTQRLERNITDPLNIIAAENMEHSSTTLRRYILPYVPVELHEKFQRTFGFPDCMIARVVPVAQDPLLITAEDYSEWTADLTAARGEPPLLRGLEWVDNQAARLQRKLYIANTGHVTCGYWGWLGKYRYIHQAAQDEQIMQRIKATIAESGQALACEHDFAAEELTAYQRSLTDKLRGEGLPDEVRRVIREPLRKLGPAERLLGPLQLCLKHSLPTANLCRSVAAVLACRLPGDPEFDRMQSCVATHGPVAALQELVGYQSPANIAEQIQKAYQEASADTVR